MIKSSEEAIGVERQRKESSEEAIRGNRRIFNFKGATGGRVLSQRKTMSRATKKRSESAMSRASLIAL